MKDIIVQQQKKHLCVYLSASTFMICTRSINTKASSVVYCHIRFSPPIVWSDTNVGADPWGGLVNSSLHFLIRRRFWHVFQTTDGRTNLQALHSPWHGPVEGKYLYLPLRSFSSASHLWGGKNHGWKRSRPHVAALAGWIIMPQVINYSAPTEKKRGTEEQRAEAGQVPLNHACSVFRMVCVLLKTHTTCQQFWFQNKFRSIILSDPFCLQSSLTFVWISLRISNTLCNGFTMSSPEHQTILKTLRSFHHGRTERLLQLSERLRVA